MTPREMGVYKKNLQDKERESAIMQDVSAWLNGFYIMKAIGCTLSKVGTYPKKHMIISDDAERDFTDDEIEEIIQTNTQIASANFAAWARAVNNGE